MNRFLEDFESSTCTAWGASAMISGRPIRVAKYYDGKCAGGEARS